jgi:hypothetical protein
VLDVLKEIFHAIGYGFMVDLVFLPIYVILGAALLGWCGMTLRKKTGFPFR